MAADWSIAVGILIFIIAIIFAVIFYYKYEKFSLVLFTASIATYIFAVFYTWDIFEESKNWIFSMLIISAILMTFLGKYFTKIKINIKPAKMHTSLKEKE